MQRRPFGPTGRQVPVIGQGTWYIDDARRAHAVDALRRGLDLGMTHIDTAEMYGDGRAEDVVGEAIQGRREDVFLVSKVLPQHADRKGVRAACERSLRRLGTDALDCYLLHWRGAVPLAETFEALEALLRAGKIRSWGVSNFDVDDLEEALALAGPGKIACNQVLYHLQERAIEHAIIPWCAEHGIAVVAYSPFGHGEFPSVASPGGSVLAAVAQRHAATPRQVALAWITREPGVFTIPKSSGPAHTEANAAAGDLRLTPQDLQQIEAAFPRGPRPGYLPML